MTTGRKYFSSGSPWEPLVGYSRAVRVGNIIEIAGTTSVRNGEIKGKGSAYEQTKVILLTIEEAVKGLGGKMSDIVRTRIYLTDISKWEEVGKAHGEVFSEIRPAASMIEVSALIDPELLVEIEATAIVSEHNFS
jgi:enamine deaminase RidA (YjgF/YER057c/UK114 family)